MCILRVLKMTNKFFVHIGHPKTGTTTLQEGFFSQHEDIAYLGRPYNNPIFKEEVRSLGLQDSTAYHPGGLKSLIDNYRKVNKNKTIVISEETFSSVNCNDRGLIADRIKEVFSPCSIIIVIRNQFDIIRSFYANFDGVILNMNRPTGKLVMFDRWLKYQWLNRHYGYFSQINYHRLIQYYIDLFGVQNVHVFLFEDFVHNKKEFFKKVLSCMAIDEKTIFEKIISAHERKGPSNREYAYMKFKSKYLLGLEPEKYFSLGHPLNKAIVSFMRKGQKPQLHFGDYEKRLHDFFKEGNNKLSNMLDLPLTYYGYPI